MDRATTARAVARGASLAHAISPSRLKQAEQGAKKAKIAAAIKSLEAMAGASLPKAAPKGSSLAADGLTSNIPASGLTGWALHQAAKKKKLTDLGITGSVTRLLDANRKPSVGVSMLVPSSLLHGRSKK